MRLSRILIKLFGISFLCVLLTAVTASVTFASTTRQTIAHVTCPTLNKGSTDRNSQGKVSVLQSKLKEAGENVGTFGPKHDGIDGIFGEVTLQAVKSYQSKHKDAQGRKLTVDGIVGPNTWDALGGCEATTSSPKTDPAQFKDVKRGCGSGDGACGSVTFTFASKTQITKVSMSVKDTKCDGHDVYIQLRVYDASGFSDVLRHRNSAGCLASPLTWNNLSYTHQNQVSEGEASPITINGVRVLVCVDDGGPNICYQSNYLDNPKA